MGPYSQLYRGQLSPGVLILLIVLIAWELYWKARGLWRSAKNNDLGWFIAILVINTVGILPIVYLYFFQKKGAKKA